MVQFVIFLEILGGRSSCIIVLGQYILVSLESYTFGPSLIVPLPICAQYTDALDDIENEGSMVMCTKIEIESTCLLPLIPHGLGAWFRFTSIIIY